MTMEIPLPPRLALALTLVGAVALASCERLGENGWPIWLVPPVLTALALCASRAQLAGAWAVLALAAGLPVGWRHEPPAIEAATALVRALDLGILLVVIRILGARGNAFVIALGAGCARAALELAWSRTPLGDGFAWGVYQIATAPLSQIVFLTGLASLGFLIVFVGAGAGILLCDVERRGTSRTLALAVAALSIVGAMGIGRLDRVPKERLRIGSVTDHSGQRSRLLTLTEQASVQLAQVLVWSGNNLTLAADDGRDLIAQTEPLVRTDPMWLVLGGVAVGRQEPLVVIVPPREAGGVPLSALPGEVAMAPAQFGGVAAMADNDLRQGDLAQTAAERGATVLGVPEAEDARLDRYRSALVRARAVEHGLAVVRASSTGRSRVLDPYGRITTETTVQAEPSHVLLTDVPLVHDAESLAPTRTGFAWTATALLFVLCLLRPGTRPPAVAEDVPPEPLVDW